jgi:hypothetical protein
MNNLSFHTLTTCLGVLKVYEDTTSSDTPDFTAGGLLKLVKGQPVDKLLGFILSLDWVTRKELKKALLESAVRHEGWADYHRKAPPGWQDEWLTWGVRYEARAKEMRELAYLLMPRSDA